MKLIYRTSDSGYNKIKPDYINNINCLNNFIKNVGKPDLIVADNVNEPNHRKQIDDLGCVKNVSIGSGAGTFRWTLDYIFKNYNDNDIVYICENDYLHKPNSMKIIQEGFDLGADYVSLYDHPDKYINGDMGGNPEVESGGEVTRLLLSKSTHWKMTNSTTMTLASRVKTLKEDNELIQQYIGGTYPRDFEMFLALRNGGRVLITPVPGYSTHGETNWLSPFTDWSKV